MSRIIEFLTANPILMIFLIGWIASLLGGAARSAARRAQQQQQRSQTTPQRAPPRPELPASRAPSGQRAELTGQLSRPELRGDTSRPELRGEMSRPVAGETTMAVAPAEPSARSADDVAAEIRRMMGLDGRSGSIAGSPAGTVAYEDLEYVEQPAPPATPAQPARSAHGGDLREQLAAKEAANEARFKSRFDDRIGRRAAEFGSAIVDRRLSDDLLDRASTAAIGQREQRRSVRRRRRGAAGPLFDASDPIRAIVAMEVLGRPRAERGWSG